MSTWLLIRFRAFQFAIVLLVSVALWVWPTVASAANARDTLANAKAALAASPPNRIEARAALERAIAAGDDPTVASEANLRLATLDEEEGALAKAVEHDRAAVAASPSSRWARTAKARMGWLADRSEGDFVPLARLMRVWSDRGFGEHADAVGAFAKEVESFPPGTVRSEARLFAADAWLHRLHEPEEGKRELLRVRDDPSSNTLSIAFAERDFAEELLAEGRLDDASVEVRLRAGELPAAFIEQVHARLRRRAFERAATGELAVFFACALSALLLGHRRGVVAPVLRKLVPSRRRALGFAACALIAAGLVHSGRAHSLAPALVAGAVAVPIVLLSWIWNAAGSSGPGARAARALFCGASVLAAAFLVFDALAPRVLARFGM